MRRPIQDDTRLPAFRTTDGGCFRIATPATGQRVLVAVPDPLGAGEPPLLVPLTEAGLRVFFEGTPMELAARYATLTTGLRSLLFGRAGDAARGAAPHYGHAMLLRKIGRVLTDPEVREALRNEPVEYLREAARHPDDPRAQLKAAMAARIKGKLGRDREAERTARARV